MDKHAPPRAFNTFNPAGHVVVAMPSSEAVDQVVQDLRRAGFSDGDVTVFTAEEMQQLAQREVDEATLAARIGQEYNLAKARLELASKGHSFLVIPAKDDDRVQAVAESARRHGAVRAQRYGTFIIEELVDVGENLSQVGESPDRGLDSQTRSGEEPDAQQAQEAQQSQQRVQGGQAGQAGQGRR